MEIAITIGALGLIVLLIGVLVFLRMKPKTAATASAAMVPTFGPVRTLALSSFGLGVVGVVLCFFERVDGQQSELVLRPFGQANVILLAISSYLILCGIVFFAIAARAGYLFIGLGFLLMGLWNVFVGVLGYFGARIESLHGVTVDSVLNAQPLIVGLLGVIMIVGGISTIAAFFKKGIS
jgi:hypothetical protein